MNTTMITSALAAFVLSAIVISGTPSLAQDSDALDDQKKIAEAQAAVAYKMKDPGSVQFRNVGIYLTETTEKEVVCGEVNAKNSYGAYSGFTVFAASGDSAFVDNDDHFTETIIASLCHKRVR